MKRYTIMNRAHNYEKGTQLGKGYTIMNRAHNYEKGTPL